MSPSRSHSAHVVWWSCSHEGYPCEPLPLCSQGCMTLAFMFSQSTSVGHLKSPPCADPTYLITHPSHGFSPTQSRSTSLLLSHCCYNLAASVLAWCVRCCFKIPQQIPLSLERHGPYPTYLLYITFVCTSYPHHVTQESP